MLMSFQLQDLISKKITQDRNIVMHVGSMTVDRVWIGNQSYLVLTLVVTNQSDSAQIYTVYSSLYHTLSLFSPLSPLVMASRGGHSPSSGFLNCPHASAKATFDSQ
jgi:hypothetical protein